MAKKIKNELNIDNVHFVQEDKVILSISDEKLITLKAEAIKNSILPKLEIIMNEAIAKIIDIYDVDVYELSGTIKSPSFRPENLRVKPTTRDYQYTACSLMAKRSLQTKKGIDIWKGVRQKDGKIAKIIDFMLGYAFDAEIGLHIQLSLSTIRCGGIKDLTDFKRFHKKYENEINWILDITNAVIPELVYQGMDKIEGSSLDKFEFVEKTKKVPLLELVDDYCKKEIWNLWFARGVYPNEDQNDEIIYNSEDIQDSIEFFICFYPVYDAYLRIAAGQPLKFEEHISKLDNWLTDLQEKQENNITEEKEPETKSEIMEKILLARIEKHKYIPLGKRYQVLSRDKHTCLSCGRSAGPNVELHVDHIIPRSKGGTDDINNLQTLCWECNIGKSNKDQTDLRKKKK